MSGVASQSNSEWQVTNLGEVVEIKYGKDHKQLAIGKIPAYGSGGVMRYVDTALYNDESILIPRKGSLNNIIYESKPFWTVDTMFWSKIDKTLVYPKFLFYQLTEIDYMNLNVGSAVPSLTVPVINAIEILLPPLDEQKSIASVLSSLDDKIDLLHRQNKTLEAMAETLFRQWFVESDGEEANTIALGEVAKFSNGKSRPDDTVGGNNPIYGGNGVLGYSVQSNSEGTSIIIGRVGAYCGSVFIERRPIWVSDNAILAKPINKKAHSYLFYLFKNLKLNEFAEGSSHPLLTQTLLNSIQINEPNPERLTLFCEQVNKWLEKVDFNKLQITRLEKIRDSLLPKLMSAEVRVRI